MNVDPPKGDGRRYYVGRVNISNPENMHYVEKNPEKLASYNQAKILHDYPDKSNVVYTEPVSKISQTKKYNFVHNMIAVKSKTNNAHLEKIVNSTILNSNKYEILHQLHEEGIEFRIMTSLKNELFDSE